MRVHCELVIFRSGWAAQIVWKRWPGWRRDVISIFSWAATQLELQALLAFGHRPMMVRRKDRFQQPWESTQKRFSGTHFPIISDVDGSAILNKLPDTLSDKITPRRQFETLRFLRFSYPKLPVQSIRQPAFGVQLDDFPNSILISRCQLLYSKINRRPPAHQIRGLTQNVINLIDGAFYPPTGNKVIVAAGQFTRNLKKPANGPRLFHYKFLPVILLFTDISHFRNES